MTVCGLRWTVTLRVSASVSVRMANKQTYNLKAYSATMDQARECQGMPVSFLFVFEHKKSQDSLKFRNGEKYSIFFLRTNFFIFKVLRGRKIL